MEMGTFEVLLLYYTLTTLIYNSQLLLQNVLHFFQNPLKLIVLHKLSFVTL
jgi:hypothetical protein